MATFLETFFHVQLVRSDYIALVIRHRVIGFCLILPIVPGLAFMSSSAASENSNIWITGACIIGVSVVASLAYFLHVLVRKETYWQLRVREQHETAQTSKDAKTELLEFAAALQEKHHAK